MISRVRCSLPTPATGDLGARLAHKRTAKPVVVGMSDFKTNEYASLIGSDFEPLGMRAQAPSDYPDMAECLVELGIDSISDTTSRVRGHDASDIQRRHHP